MQVRTLLIGMALTLSGCQLPDYVQTMLPAQEESSSATTSLSIVSSGSGLEYGDAEPVSSMNIARPMSTPVIPVEERLLPDGTLEVGDPNAPVTITLITHHSCSYCATMTEEELPRVIQDFVAHGTAKVHIQLLQLKKYPQSMTQEKFFYCAAKQGKGMIAHHELLKTNVTASKADAAFAKKVGITTKDFQNCIAADETNAVLQAMQQNLEAQKVTVVPILVINGTTMTGLPDYGDLKGAIEDALRKANY